MTVDPSALDTDLYRKNAFRLLGMPTNSSLKRLKRGAGNLMRELEDGGSAADRVIGRFVPLPDGPEINAAVGRLEDPAARLLDEIFWFRGDDADDRQLTLLRDLGPAGVAAIVDEWQAAEDEADLHDLTATHNLAIFNHLVALELDARHARELSGGGGKNSDALQRLQAEADAAWQAALVRWRHLLGQSGFWTWARERAQAIGAGRLDMAHLDQLQKTLLQGLIGISVRLMQRAAEQGRDGEVERQRRLLTQAGLADSEVKSEIERQLEPLLARVHKRIDAFSNEVEADKSGAGKRATKLIEELGPLLALGDRLLGRDHRTLADLHEAFASALNRAQVVYSEATQDYEPCLKLLERALQHARGSELRRVLNRNLDFVRCHFCGKRACVKGREYKLDMFKITSVTPHTGQVLYSTMKLNLPRCYECWQKWGGPQNVSSHPIVREEREAGWKLGSQPSDEDIAEFLRRHW